jgi:S1-C subfamily serine protease
MLSAVVSLRAEVPDDAFTAQVLGTERAGNGVVIGDNGLVLTIGYLITEAEKIWLTTNDGQVAQAHVVGYDQATGFGLVQALARFRLDRSRMSFRPAP